MPFDEDLSVFFDDDDFASTATLNGTASGNVIFDREHLDALGVVSSANPEALAIASEYGTGVVTGTLAIAGTSYTIRDRQPQFDGAVVLLQLEKQ